MTEAGQRPLRSRLWFDNPQNPGMTALYLERYLNFEPAVKYQRVAGKSVPRDNH